MINHVFILQNITLDEIAEKVDISRRAVMNNINKLKELELVQRIGPAKGGHWKILKK